MPDDYDLLCADVRKMTNRMDAESAAWTLLGCVAGVTDELTGGHSEILVEGAGAIYNKIKGIQSKKKGPIPNPWFVFNGHEDRDNKVTKKYKQSRKFKSVGGSIASVAGAVASSHTAGINVTSSIMHANATGTTLAHMMQVKAVARSIPNSKTIDQWCDVILKAKLAKATIRGGQLVTGFIPGAHAPAAIAAAIAKTGFKLTMTNSVYSTAASVHWRAFQEQAISGGRGMGTGRKIGPASRLFYEIFTKRGMTALLGRYDIASLIQEPGGWEALADKLMLI